MCIRGDCSIGSHNVKLVETVFGDWVRVGCILDPTRRGDSENATAVFAQPTVPADLLEAQMPDWDTVVRPVDSLQSAFNALNEPSELVPGPMERAEAVKRAAQEVTFAFTPKKPRVLRPGGTPEDFDFVGPTLPPVLEGDTVEEQMASLRATWRTLVENIDGSVGASSSVQNRLRELATNVEDELAALEVKVSRLKTFMGDRPAEVGTVTVFQWL